MDSIKIFNKRVDVMAICDVLYQASHHIIMDPLKKKIHRVLQSAESRGTIVPGNAKLFPAATNINTGQLARSVQADLSRYFLPCSYFFSNFQFNVLNFILPYSLTFFKNIFLSTSPKFLTCM